MRAIQVYFLLICMIMISSCYPRQNMRNAAPASKIEGSSSLPVEKEALSKAIPHQREKEAAGGGGAGFNDSSNNISLQKVSNEQTSNLAYERKIIRNAEMVIETSNPVDGQRKIAAIAEKNGGFVVTSESKENPGELQAKPAITVTIIARVPAARFNEALEEILKIGGRVLQQKTSGQDVTEEYIDLEARLRAKRALEMQFLEIMKQARKISDALEVQNQLTEVRTEIESLEGRRRFLQNQATLSTITATLHTPLPIAVATTRGIRPSIYEALGDGIDTATAIVLGVIHFIIVMIPVFLLILLPCWFLFKRLRPLRHLIPMPKKSEPAISGSAEAD
jgi:Domain of unknown function (DUF4349)